MSYSLILGPIWKVAQSATLTAIVKGHKQGQIKDLLPWKHTGTVRSGHHVLCSNDNADLIAIAGFGSGKAFSQVMPTLLIYPLGNTAWSLWHVRGAPTRIIGPNRFAPRWGDTS